MLFSFFGINISQNGIALTDCNFPSLRPTDASFWLKRSAAIDFLPVFQRNGTRTEDVDMIFDKQPGKLDSSLSKDTWSIHLWQKNPT